MNNAYQSNALKLYSILSPVILVIGIMIGIVLLFKEQQLSPLEYLGEGLMAIGIVGVSLRRYIEDNG